MVFDFLVCIFFVKWMKFYFNIIVYIIVWFFFINYWWWFIFNEKKWKIRVINFYLVCKKVILCIGKIFLYCINYFWRLFMVLYKENSLFFLYIWLFLMNGWVFGFLKILIFLIFKFIIGYWLVSVIVKYF